MLNLSVQKFEQWGKLNAFFSNTNSFIKLFNNNCILSGSIIVQFLLNENYDSSDIDVFLTINEIKKFNGFLLDEKYSEVSNERDYFNIDFKIPLVTKPVMDVKTYNKSVYVNGVSVRYTVQLIIVEDPIKVIQDFDFDIVKNYYDGKCFNYTNSLESKTETLTFIELKYLSDTQKDRMEKYISRDFKFVIRKP